MKIQPDNLFVGANILNSSGEKFLVIKVNAKSFYAAKGITLSEYNTLFNNRVKGTTFKKFCEMSGYGMYKYTDPFEISEEELGKREVISQSNNVNVDVLKKTEKTTLTNLIKYNKLKPMVSVGSGSSIMRLIEKRDDDKFLLNVDSCYILYNRSLDISCKVCSVLDWGVKVKEVPWEKITPRV